MTLKGLTVLFFALFLFHGALFLTTFVSSTCSSINLYFSFFAVRSSTGTIYLQTIARWWLLSSSQIRLMAPLRTEDAVPGHCSQSGRTYSCGLRELTCSPAELRSKCHEKSLWKWFSSPFFITDNPERTVFSHWTSIFLMVGKDFC